MELAVAAYLTMLLDTGSLHADPHPGNLLLTPSGALCILDFGLVAHVTRQQQYAILAYISHLVGRDYSAIAGDLIAMGFVPESKRTALEDSGVVGVLSEVFRALAKGGGVRAVSKELGSMSGGYGGSAAGGGGNGGNNGEESVSPLVQELRESAGKTPAAPAGKFPGKFPPAKAESGGARPTARVEVLQKDIGYIQTRYGNILQVRLRPQLACVPLSIGHAQGVYCAALGASIASFRSFVAVTTEAPKTVKR